MTKREAYDILDRVEIACIGLASEMGDPFNGFYRGGTSAFMKFYRKVTNNPKFDSKFVKDLLKIRNVFQGLTSETDDPFHGVFKGGTKELMRQFDSVLSALGVEFKEPIWAAVEYYDRTAKCRKWAITGNPDDPKDMEAWVLTGFHTKEEAEKTIGEDWFKEAAAA